MKNAIIKFKEHHCNEKNKKQKKHRTSRHHVLLWIFLGVIVQFGIKKNFFFCIWEDTTLLEDWKLLALKALKASYKQYQKYLKEQYSYKLENE